MHLCQDQEDELVRAAAVSTPEEDTLLGELEDWLFRLSMRGVSPAIIAAPDGRVLAATRTNQLTGEPDQLVNLCADIRSAVRPGDTVSFAGVRYVLAGCLNMKKLILTWYTCGLKRNGPGRAACALVGVVVGISAAAFLWLALSRCGDPFAPQLSVITLEGLDRTHMFYFARDLVPWCNNSPV